jgi:hypothetical protein
MPKAPEFHTLYLRKFPLDVTRRVRAVAALRGCTISHALALILRDYFAATNVLDNASKGK